MPYNRKLFVQPTTEDLQEKETKQQKRLNRLHTREAELLASEKRWRRRHRRATNALKKIVRAQKRIRILLDNSQSVKSV